MATARAAYSSADNRRDVNEMERIRLRAARLVEQGTSQAEVAHRLGTSRQNAHRFHCRWRQGGRAALRATGRAGRKTQTGQPPTPSGRTSPRPGRLAHGFDSDLWTLQRVASSSSA